MDYQSEKMLKVLKSSTKYICEDIYGILRKTGKYINAQDILQ